MDRRKAVEQDLLFIARTLASQSELSQETARSVVESSSTVHLTNKEFCEVGEQLSQSKSLTTKYARREVTNKVLLIMAFIFFYSSVFYVIFKRWLSIISF